MSSDPQPAAQHGAISEKAMTQILGSMSVFTMLMTIPQVLTIWVGQQAAGVSVVSWSAYLIAAVLWFWHGVQKHDKNIYLACIGWIVLDIAVIAGAVIYG